MCFGTVVHHRRAPTDHRFTYPTNQIWLDPDDPDALFSHHPLWSSTRPAPIRFRRRDYLDGGSDPIGPSLRRLIEPELGWTPTGPIRMLTQPRTWGWLFNPITVYLLWDSDVGSGAQAPVAAVLEVTNTPWKERHRYAVPLTDDAGTLTATFDKSLHVSPFLDEHYSYVLRLSETMIGERPRLMIDLDVVDNRIHGPTPGGLHREAPPARGHSIDHQEQRHDGPSDPIDELMPATPTLTTRLVVDRNPADRSTMTRALTRNPLPTHRVSLGIHGQALRLWRKRVPFVPHPDRRQTDRAPSAEPTSDRR